MERPTDGTRKGQSTQDAERELHPARILDPEAADPKHAVVVSDQRLVKKKDLVGVDAGHRQEAEQKPAVGVSHEALSDDEEHDDRRQAADRVDGDKTAEEAQVAEP